MKRIQDLFFLAILVALSAIVVAGLYCLLGGGLFFLFRIDIFPYFWKVCFGWIIFFLFYVHANKRFYDVIYNGEKEEIEEIEIEKESIMYVIKDFYKENRISTNVFFIINFVNTILFFVFSSIILSILLFVLSVLSIIFVKLLIKDEDNE